jgi:two-component system nitrate/nitrite response regulator NarL
MQPGRIRVGILEDQQIFLESLVSLFQQSDMEVVVQGQDVEGFLARVRETPPDVAVVDLRLESVDGKEVGDGLKVVQALREQQPQVRVLVLTGHRELPLIERCFQLGAAGYLCKLNVSCAALVSAVEQVARGEWLVPPELVSPVQVLPRQEPGVRASPLDRLTLREREVLGLVAAGADNLQISARLGITERTVKAHVSNLYRKLGVQNRVEMAMLAYQSGLSSPVEAQHP